MEKVGLWRTSVQRSRTAGSTVLSSTTLSKLRITTLDCSVPAMISVRMNLSSDVSGHKLKVFRKAVEQYVKDHGSEWIELASMEMTDVRMDSTEYELFVRHRQLAGNFGIIRESRASLLNFCYQVRSHLGIGVGSIPSAPHAAPKDTGGYSDDLSADSIFDAENELYFLANSTQ